MLEFYYEDEEGNFLGRHAWCSADTFFRWGAWDKAIITQSDRSHLKVKYLDHVWTNGWNYARADD